MQARTEEKRAVQARIELNAAEYIGKSLGELREKEAIYKKIAYLWYCAPTLLCVTDDLILDPGLAKATGEEFSNLFTAPIRWPVGLLGVLSSKVKRWKYR
jgi:hypothetical protein